MREKPTSARSVRYSPTMKAASMLIPKLAGVAVVFLCWRYVGRHVFSRFLSVILVWGAIALVPLLAAAGRWLLDRHASAECATLLTIPIHYLEMILLGCSLLIAFRFTQAFPVIRVPFPRCVSGPVLEILGLFAALTVLNLAIEGLGLPLAAILSKTLATSWLYARSRNPMLLSSLLFLILGALWLPSFDALLWTTLWLSPTWILYVRLYEERELELRFGEPHLLYKAETPFFFALRKKPVT